MVSGFRFGEEVAVATRCIGRISLMHAKCALLTPTGSSARKRVAVQRFKIKLRRPGGQR